MSPRTLTVEAGKPTTWAVQFVPKTFDAERRAVKVIAYNRGFSRLARNPRDPWFGDTIEETFSLEPEHMRSERMAHGVPLMADHKWSAGLFDTHPLGGLASQLGKFEDIQITEQGIEGECRFSSREDIAWLVRDVEAGLIDSVSIGALTYSARIEEREGQPDLWTWIDWELVELSFTPIQADPRARTQSARGPQELQEPTMTLRRNLNEEEKPEGEETEDKKTEGAEGADGDGDGADDDAEKDDVNERAQRLAMERIKNAKEARKLAAKLGIDPDKAEELALSCKDYTEAKLKMIEMVGKRQQSSGQIHGEHVSSVEDVADKRRRAMSLVLEHRMIGLSGAKRERPKLDDEVTQNFRRKKLLDLGELLLSERGIKTRHLNDNQLAERLLSSASDFPLLLADAAGKILLAAFESRPSPWKQFARERNAPDFKSMKLLRRSSAPKLKKIAEDGEIQFGGFSERQEEAQLETYGIGVRFTRKMLVNDDLGAFATGVLGLGDSVADNRDDIMVGIFTSNPVMADCERLFSAAHKNIVTPTGVGLTTIEAAEDLLAAQTETLKDGSTKRLNMDLTGWFGARREAVSIDKITNPRFSPTEASEAPGSMSLNKAIFWDNRLALTPRYYYGMDLGRTGLIYGGLEGDSAPRFSDAIEFNTDGIVMKAVDDFFGGLEGWEWVVRVAA